MKTTFTKGPWKVESGMVFTEDGIPIARMDREPGNGTSPVERDENARLIAKSPRMYQALTEIMHIADDNQYLIQAIAREAISDREKPDKKDGMSPYDRETVRFALQAYGHLMPFGKQFTYAELADEIEKHYSLDIAQNKEVVRVLRYYSDQAC